jgi:hypothetical protein
MLRSIIGQLLNTLLRQDHDIPPEIWDLHKNYVKAKQSPDMDTLNARALSMIKRFDRVYIVLNALDESESDRDSQEIQGSQDRQHKRNLRKMLLRWITEMPGSGASILVTSREESDIKRALSGDTVCRVPIQTCEVDNDVKLHVERYIRDTPKLNKLPTDIIAEIKDKLISGSQGM